MQVLILKKEMKVKGREDKRRERKREKNRGKEVLFSPFFFKHYMPCVTIILAHALSLSEVNFCVSKA